VTVALSVVNESALRPWVMPAPSSVPGLLYSHEHFPGRVIAGGEI
jgi:hypothetical protein